MVINEDLASGRRAVRVLAHAGAGALQVGLPTELWTVERVRAVPHCRGILELTITCFHRWISEFSS